MTLIFNNQSVVPSTSSVEDALTEALSSGQIALNIISGSIIAPSNEEGTLELQFTLNQQFTEELSNQNSQEFKDLAENITKESAAPTVPNTAVPTGPPSNDEGTLELQFRLNQQFTQELSNQNSQQFKDLARNITKEVNTVYKTSFPSTYSRSGVNRFWNGSVGVDMTLIFKKQSVVPSTSAVEDALTEALSSGQIALSIIPGSIIARETTETTTAAAPTTSTSGPSPLRKAHLVPLSLSLVFTYLAQILIL
ncbi:hypothetical protein AAFF_G00307410 [Aldrovandia affinis]|uniref:SEA domain-containing protein n=1 Tax=Aldrovandia affinis TaxID=143900 RepID=A0AAD7W0X5_9TELE|nr:hypothetical protein AAFF_G00307410 [Aldrovandia affinis]